MTSSTVSDGEKRIEFPESWLKRPEPIEIDVGCHRGTFLVAMAEKFPDIRFLGIERQASRVARCVSKIDRLGLRNAHAVQCEGIDALAGMGGVRAIHVSFPDPWPKRRHWDRRLVNESFLEAAWKLLEPGGVLRLMTDDEPYFRAMEASIARTSGFRGESWDDGREYPETEFQKKFAAAAKPVYRVAIARCESMSSE